MASSLLESRQDTERRREDAICAVALELLLEQGYAGMSLDAVVKRAHISKTTLYARWSGKAELVVDALRRSSATAPDEDLGSLRADLVALGTATLGREDNARLSLALAAAVQDEPAVAAAVVGLGSNFRTRGEAILARAVDRGEIDGAAVDLPYVLNLLPALGITQQLFAPHDPLDVEVVVDRVLLPLLTRKASS